MDKMTMAFALFDDYNKQDPRPFVWEGTAYPEEYFLALRLHEWVRKLYPGASESLLLASRCQHIGRWIIPRSEYPEGKTGYLRWRKALQGFHAAKAAELLVRAGYGAEMAEAVGRILRKEHIRTDPDVQAMEDALCLVFLEYQLDDFVGKHPADKVRRILERTWKKMSQTGRHAARALSYSKTAAVLVAGVAGA